MSSLRHNGTIKGRDRSPINAAELHKLTNTNGDVQTQAELLARFEIDDDPENGVAILSTTAPNNNGPTDGTDTCLIVPTCCDTHGISAISPVHPNKDRPASRHTSFSHEAQTAGGHTEENHLGMSTMPDADSDVSEQQVWPATLYLRPDDQQEWAAIPKMQIFSSQVSIDGFISTVAKVLKVPTHRLDLLAHDASQHTVHMALVIPPLEIRRLIRYPRTCGMEIQNPMLMPLAKYFTAMKSAPSLAFDNAWPCPGTAAHMLMTEQIETLIMTQGAHDTSAPKPNEQNDDTSDRAYRGRHLLETEKALIDRMVDRLNHQLKHLLPHDPDDKQFTPLDRYEGYDDVDYSAYYGEIENVLHDDAISTRHRPEQRRIMHSIITKTLSTNRLIASDPLSAPKAYWEHCQNLYVEQQRRIKDGPVVHDAWLPIEQLATGDSSYCHTSETEADLNQGGVSLLQAKFPQRTVPEYLHKAVINFRCKQFLDVDQVQRQFQEQLDRLETAHETHRRDPANAHQDLTWSGNPLLVRGKIRDIAQQMSRQCNEAIVTYNASPDTNGNGIANRPIKVKLDFWREMKTHNASIGCTTPEHMWTMLKDAIDREKIFEDEDNHRNLKQLNLKDELERRRIWTQGRTYAPVTQSSKWLKLQAEHDHALPAPTNYSYRGRNQARIRNDELDNEEHIDHYELNDGSEVDDQLSDEGGTNLEHSWSDESDDDKKSPSDEDGTNPEYASSSDESDDGKNSSITRAALQNIAATPIPNMNDHTFSADGRVEPWQTRVKLFGRDGRRNEKFNGMKIRPMIIDALGEQGSTANDLVYATHDKRIYESRLLDSENAPRNKHGFIIWSAKTIALYKAPRIRNHFLMGEIDPDDLTAEEKTWAFDEFDRDDSRTDKDGHRGMPICICCGKAKHTLLNCDYFDERRACWKPGGLIHDAYKDKWAKQDQLSTPTTE